MPATEWRGDIHCVTRWSKQNTYWVGVQVLRPARARQAAGGATHVVQHADNDYTTNLPLAEMPGDDVLVAYEFDGQPIEPIHGGPVRLLVPKKYFWKSAKWVHGIELLDHDRKASGKCAATTTTRTPGRKSATPICRPGSAKTPAERTTRNEDAGR